LAKFSRIWNWIEQKVIDTPITGSNGPTKEFLADEFTVELEHAWVTVYGMIADTMIEAAEN